VRSKFTNSIRQTECVGAAFFGHMMEYVEEPGHVTDRSVEEDSFRTFPANSYYLA